MGGSGSIIAAAVGITGTPTDVSGDAGNSASFATILDITSGSGNLLHILFHATNSISADYNRLQVTSDGNVVGDNLTTNIGLNISGGNGITLIYPFAGIPFTTSLKIEAYITHASNTARVQAIYTLD